MPDPRVISSTAAAFRAWVASGACQSESGAFVGWVDLASGRLSPDYAEITGYALTFLASQPSLADDELAVGRRAVMWLADRTRRGTLAAREGWDNGAIYLFDLAMAASGLLSFGRRLGAEETVEAGLDLVSFLVDELVSAELICAVSARGRPTGRRSWSTHGRAHLAKLVQAFLLSGRLADLDRLAGLVDMVKNLQRADGSMVTQPGEETTMLHPHLYAAEGLWIWGSATGDADALERAHAAAEWAWTHQLETGGFPRTVSDLGRQVAPVEQCDVTAQAVRLALVLKLPSRDVGRAIARMVGLVRGSGESLAIVYQPASRDLHLNTGATFFAAQALAMALPGAPAISWRELV